MRIYLPLTVTDLTTEKFTVSRAHAVTPRLRAEILDVDDEYLEYVATLAAADDALRLLTADDKNLRRLVGVTQVPAEAVKFSTNTADLVTTIYLETPILWENVESLLVDEPGHEDLVRTAILGDENAFMDTENIELLWYDISEKEVLARELNA